MIATNKTELKFKNCEMRRYVYILRHKLLLFYRAVESGDLNKVEKILEKYKDLESNEDESVDENEEKQNVQVIENGVKNERELSVEEELPENRVKSLRLSDLSGSNQSISSEPKICVEMVDLKEDQPQVQIRPGPARKRRLTNRRLSAVNAGLWQKVATNVTSPLPVSLVKQTSFQRVGNNSLDVNAKSDSNRKAKFNKNCKDQWGRSALFIAMIHQDLDMLELLLLYKVRCS